MFMRLSQFRNLSEEELKSKVNALVNEKPDVEGLNDRIRELEIRYEISSKEAREKYREGKLPDTAEMNQWMIFLDALGDE